MRAQIDMQDRAMWVLQGHLRLCVMSMSGVVCQRRAPDPTGQEADHGGGNGDVEAQAAARESKGGTITDAADTIGVTTEGGDG